MKKANYKFNIYTVTNDGERKFLTRATTIEAAKDFIVSRRVLFL